MMPDIVFVGRCYPAWPGSAGCVYFSWS
jgi:hypothetical protein